MLISFMMNLTEATENDKKSHEEIIERFLPNVRRVGQTLIHPNEVSTSKKKKNYTTPTSTKFHISPLKVKSNSRRIKVEKNYRVNFETFVEEAENNFKLWRDENKVGELYDDHTVTPEVAQRKLKEDRSLSIFVDAMINHLTNKKSLYYEQVITDIDLNTALNSICNGYSLRDLRVLISILVPDISKSEDIKNVDDLIGMVKTYIITLREENEEVVEEENAREEDSESEKF